MRQYQLGCCDFALQHDVHIEETVGLKDALAMCFRRSHEYVLTIGQTCDLIELFRVGSESVLSLGHGQVRSISAWLTSPDVEPRGFNDGQMRAGVSSTMLCAGRPIAIVEPEQSVDLM